MIRAISLIAKAVLMAYPDSVGEHVGAPFVRPAFTGDRTKYSSGFYWENSDADRFYFSTFDEAAEDLANDIGMDETEARAVLACGHAVA